jgi:hypothetical protein
MTLTFGTPPPIATPDHLPDPTSFLQFDISEKKNEIFQAARIRISNSAQFTKSRRKPWTQITVNLPIKANSTDDEDLAVIWSILKKANIYEVKENENSGDWTWTICGSDAFLEWLNVDWENTKPVDKFVHPVLFETGARKKTMLTTKLKKARAFGDVSLAMKLECELEAIANANAAANTNAEAGRPTGNDYHWADYEECIVTYKKKQTRKAAHNELQLTVKIRTYHLGTGDPRENNGYLRGSSRAEGVLDPESDGYRLMQLYGF